MQRVKAKNPAWVSFRIEENGVHTFLQTQKGGKSFLGSFPLGTNLLDSMDEKLFPIIFH